VYAVIHENEKSIPCTLLYESYGMRISDCVNTAVAILYMKSKR